MGTQVKAKEEDWGYGSFRDSLSTVDKTGKRVWVYAKKPKGKWFVRRSIVGYGLLAFLVAAPFLKVNGRQMLQFDFLHRKFILFGQVFWPHDFFIFLLAFIAVLLFIILFTAIYGRLWCGWTCPQTIFMELIFRRIEYMMEGDAMQQKKLSRMEWNTEKILRRGGKYVLFYLVSFLIANIFLAYIVGSEQLWKIMTEPITQHLGGFIAIVLFSGVFFFVYSYLREQVCTIICPYGRLQGVLLDSESLTVAYDHKRGEGREKWGRKRSETAGDCIDCRQCVDVCPTGIDIRDGMQLECVNCTACIDACNHVMQKIGKPIDLIKFASLKGIEERKGFHINGRRTFYSILLGVIVAGLITILSLRTDVQATILRTPGITYDITPEGVVKNIYNFKVLNKTFEDIPVQLKLENVPGNIRVIGKDIIAPAEEYGEGIISIEIPREKLQSSNAELQIGVYANGEKIQTVETNFMAP